VAVVRGALGRRRDVLTLAAGILLWAVADLAAQVGATLAAALWLAGSVAVGGWLLWRSREHLLSRVVASFLVALLVLVLGLASVGGVAFTADLRTDELDRLETAVTGRARQVLEEWPLQLLTTAQLFSSGALAERVATGDPQVAEQTARTVAALPLVDVVVLIRPGGDVLSSYDWGVRDRGRLPGGDELLLAGDPLVQRALGGNDASGVVTLGTDVLAVAAIPVYPTEAGEPRRDRLVGVLVTGRRVTDPVFLAEFAAASGGDASVVVAGTVAASTLTRGTADVADAIAGGERRGLVQLRGEPTLLVSAPLESGVDTLGWLVLTEDAVILARAERDFARTLFLAALAGVAAAGLLAGWAANRTTRPVRRLTQVAEEVAAGNRQVRTGIDQPDEVGRLAVTFDEMTAALSTREDDLRAAAAVESALRGRLEVLTASIGEGLAAVDVDGAVQTLNPAGERLLGTSAADAVGRAIEEVLVGTDDTGASLVDALGGPADRHIRAARGEVDGDGRRVPVAATAAPMVAVDGTRLGRVYVLRDITGEAEVERMKTEFLANMSHELRTPLTPIRGYAEVLRKRELPHERVADFAGSIVASVTRLERIVGMLVDFAALEAGRISVQIEPTDLDTVVDQVLASWRERHPDRRFTRRLARDLPPVSADAALLNRVLEELVDNAVKFSEGPVRLVAEGADGHVRLTVRDAGVGIDPQEATAIMRDFHQLDSSATRRYGGLGLGLSLVRRIADRFGATVTVESVPGAGTDVHLLLPTDAQAGR
ncbi:MAG: ATP-binding protein, partial [Actinomycetota bacterium]|nr:ATP-binding protein [Actinomycetota bacterium]